MIKKLLSSKKAGIYSLVFTISVLGITLLWLFIYTGNSTCGNFKWLFLQSEYFGMPKEIQEGLDMEPVYSKANVGWDGQFYHYISNDILGKKGFSKYVDAPSYRWQRIGLPLLANIMSKIFGQKYVSIPVYLLTNLIILAFAIFIFAKFLYQKHLSMFYMFPWCFSLGVQLTFRHGLMDGAADAFVIIAIIMLIKKKYSLYSISMILACLTREGYVCIAFFTFIFGLFGILDKNKQFDIKFAIKLAMPGVFFVLWYLYVTLKFNAFPFSQSGGITQFFLIGYIQHLILALKSANIFEFVGLNIYFITIVFTLIMCIFIGKKNKVFWLIVPYIILVGSFGKTVMFHYSGYLKGISFLFAIIPLLLIEYKNQKEKIYIGIFNCEDLKCKISFKNFLINGTKIFLVLTLLFSIRAMNKFNQNVIPYALFISNSANQEGIPAINDFSSKLEIINKLDKKYANIPFSNIFTKEYSVYSLKIANLSKEIWKKDAQVDGLGAVYVSYQWYKKDNLNDVVFEGFRNTLPRDILPGEEFEMDVFIEYPKESGEYALRISLLQEGFSWFYWQNSGGYIDVPIKFQN